MNEDLHNIDDLFRKSLEENKELPDDSVWDNIDKTLDKKNVVSISKKYNKLKWAAAVLFLFSLGMAMYTFHIKRQNMELVKQNKHAKNAIKPKLNNELATKDSLTADLKRPGHNLDNTSNKYENLKINVDSNAVDSTKEVGADKEITGNTGKEKKQIKATRYIALENQKKIRFKSDTAFELKVDKGIIGSGINITTKATRKFATENNELTRTQTNNNSYYIIDDKQKNIETELMAPGLKNDFQISTQKPVIQIDIRLHQQAIALNNNKKSSIKKSKEGSAGKLLSATVFFSPDIISTALKDDHPRFREEQRNAIEKSEHIKFSSTVGILIDYTIAKNLKIESGFTYSSRKTLIHPKTIYARPDNDGNINYRFNCSAGYSYINVESAPRPASGDSLRALAATNNLQYIGLPIYAKYIFKSGRFTLLPGAGISFNFLTMGKIATTIATSYGAKNFSINKIQGLKSMYLNGEAGIGVQCNLNKNFSLSFEPNFRFALSPINKEAPVKTNLNSIGLSGGIVFQF